MSEATAQDDLKRAAGQAAAERVRSGMRLGLGTGSTVAYFLDALASLITAGDLTDVVGVPTSERTGNAAKRLGIPLGTLSELRSLDLTVDGADEVSPSLDLIKGLGGALLREKMVAQASDRLLIIADEGKTVDTLGTLSPLPVEVVPFEHESQLPWLRAQGCEPEVRRSGDGTPYVTDNGNLIVDCRFSSGIVDPAQLDRALAGRSGVVESGLFLGMATEALIAEAGGVRSCSRTPPPPERKA